MMVDKQLKFRPTKIDIKVNNYVLSPQEEMEIVMKWVKQYPEVIRIMLDVIQRGKKIRCPFPFECNEFPCSDLNCNADVCSNGYAYRMS